MAAGGAEQFLQAVDECRRIIDAEDKSRFTGEPEPFGGFISQRANWTHDALSVKYELSHTVAEDNSTPPLWQCMIRPDGRWDVPAVQTAMEQFVSAHVEPANSDLDVEKYRRLGYYDCSDPNTPVSLYFEAEKDGGGLLSRPDHWFVSVEKPALESGVCFNQVPLRKVTDACTLYLSGAPGEIEGMTQFTQTGPNTREGFVRIEHGGVTLRLVDTEQPECWMLGAKREAGGWKTSFSWNAALGPIRDEMVGFDMLTQGYQFRTEDGHSGVYMCEGKRAGIQMYVSSADVQSGPPALQVFMTKGATEGWDESCDYHQREKAGE